MSVESTTYYKDPQDLLQDRSSWLRVDVMRNKYGTYDVVLRIDGSYTDRGSANEMVDHFRETIGEMLEEKIDGKFTDWTAP